MSSFAGREGTRERRDFGQERAANNHSRTQRIYDHATKLVIGMMYALFVSVIAVAIVLFVERLLAHDWAFFKQLMEDLLKYVMGGLTVFAINHGMVKRL